MSVSFNHIPRDVKLLVFSYLRAEELGRCSRVCKVWHALANTESLWRALPLPSIAFGKREWEKYLGDVGEEPPLPREVYKVLRSPCPFWEGKRVEETHLLTLVPRSVNGQLLTLDSLNQLMQHPKQGQPAKYASYWEGLSREYGSTSLLKSTWVLMTKDVILGSRAKDVNAQMQLLIELSQKAGMAYEAPKLLETATSIFMEYLRKEKRVYSEVFTRCQEKVSGNHVGQTGLGSFDEDGLWVLNFIAIGDNFGIGGMRKF